MVLVLVVLVILHLVQVLVGGAGDAGDQQHRLPKTDLGVLVHVQVLHDLIQAGFVLHVLEERRGGGKLHHKKLHTGGGKRFNWDLE